MSQMIHCWSFPTKSDNRLEAMRYGRVLRQHLPMIDADTTFDVDRPIHASHNKSLRQMRDIAWDYRQRFLLVPDGCYGIESPGTYHRRPHEMDPDRLWSYFKPAFEFIAEGPSEPLYGVEVFNEAGFISWISKRATWNELEPIYKRYERAFKELFILVGNVFGDELVIVGGDNSRWWRNQEGQHPSLSYWMATEHGAKNVAWHPSSRLSPSEIEVKTRELARRVRVHVTEDVYQYVPNAEHRAAAAYAGGALCWSGWSAWAFDAWDNQPGIAMEGSGGKRDKLRLAQLIHASSTKPPNRYRPNLQPREQLPPVEPPPVTEPDDYEALARAEYDLWWHYMAANNRPAVGWSGLGGPDKESLIRKQGNAESARGKLS